MIRFLLLVLTLGLGGCAKDYTILVNLNYWTAWVFPLGGLTIVLWLVRGVCSLTSWRAGLIGSILIIFIAACAPPTQAAEPLNQALLRDVICHHETRGERARGENIDLLPPGPNGELGRCQITLAGAKRVGFDESQWLLLLIGPFSEYWAGQVIADCVVRGRSTAYSAAFCYNAGPRARISKWHPSHQYAMAVQEGYNRALVEKGRN